MRTIWVSLLAAALGADPAVASTKAAVVNIPVVSEKYAKTSELEAQFEAVRKKINGDRDALREKIERAKRSAQEELKPGTEEFRQRLKEIALMEAEFQWFTETEGQKVERGLAESLKSIFTDIQAAIREVAQEKGLDVVLAADQLPPETPENPAQVRQHILLQKVLYWSPAVDITEDVVTRLNANYKSSGGTPGLSIESVQIKPKEPAPQPPPKKP